jgi:hypothetical protein
LGYYCWLIGLFRLFELSSRFSLSYSNNRIIITLFKIITIFSINSKQKIINSFILCPARNRVLFEEKKNHYSDAKLDEPSGSRFEMSATSTFGPIYAGVPLPGKGVYLERTRQRGLFTSVVLLGLLGLY